MMRHLLTASLALLATVEGNPSEPVVNLGYSTYQGYYNTTTGLNIWKGIRYAAPPINELRWQPPVAPLRNTSHILPAVDQPPVCPQSGAARTPAVYGFKSGPGDEDCLYLNVYAPPEASDLPVFVWIHGGGYGLFGAVYDPSPLMNTNDNGFITVEIQYRLGAFGFLSSAEVHERGALNAGLLDQRFALQWVQQHITKFGGNPKRVTIGGESAGAGAAMLHSLAYGGKESNLFQNIIAASPYLVPVYPYDDPVPTGHYEAFVEKTGCGPSAIAKARYNSSFDCLVAAPSEKLQNAIGVVSESGLFGTFAFLPVVDNDMIRERPSAQLLSGKVSGQRVLVGNNANDGAPLSNPNVVTRTAFNSYLSETFPNFTEADLAQLKLVYDTADSQSTDDSPRFDTLGTSGPTAKNQSEVATGLQQTVFNIFAESTFDCPAQWFAEAFGGSLRQAWKYQYSVTPAYHGADLNAYFPRAASWPSKRFNHAFQKVWGSFIMNNSPIIPIQDATGNQSHAIVPEDPSGQLDWPQFHPSAPWHMDFNTTGGSVSPLVITPNLTYYIRQGDDVVNHFRLANAYTWEGGRGVRCLFWRAAADRIPL
ncbi:Alpha/Beta hydrolase protein [Aspergillus pseudonomiae]|uniref:Carboxylic ester hydrolase n=1 Tax=Aspergillus pseudonomiae TaxID=1506151 RepID=A0A5N7DHY3_9EURO|nr:Alpha/Beta hydrolase protein [Aspergillus pseudonomiae]KAE8405623.1 Alpha/Beta hydrolase protein [Aspergillus pseudonomiae]